MYAQGLVVGSMTLCIGWGVAKFYYKKWFTTPEDTSAAIPDTSSKWQQQFNSVLWCAKMKYVCLELMPIGLRSNMGVLHTNTTAN